jgi:hypothetical protein
MRDVPGMGVPLPLLFDLAASSAALILLGGSMALRARRALVVSGREEMIGSQWRDRLGRRRRGLGAGARRALARARQRPAAQRASTCASAPSTV